MSEHKKEVLWDGRFLQMIQHGDWQYTARKGITGTVGIVAITDDRKIVLVQEYRGALETEVIDIPAGLAGDLPDKGDESFESAARRELLEETGYEAETMTFVSMGTTSCGLTNEQMAVFKATGIKKVAPGGGDDFEDIQVHEIPLIKLKAWLKEQAAKGFIIDTKVACLTITIL